MPGHGFLRRCRVSGEGLWLPPLCAMCRRLRPSRPSVDLPMRWVLTRKKKLRPGTARRRHTRGARVKRLGEPVPFPGDGGLNERLAIDPSPSPAPVRSSVARYCTSPPFFSTGKTLGPDGVQNLAPDIIGVLPPGNQKSALFRIYSTGSA